MCGITGIWNLDRAPVAQAAIDLFTDALAHRGPDGRGTWHDRGAGLALGHRRLAILDLSGTGTQPMSYLDRRYWITYNGELYNFIELRDELTGLGYQFRSSSDTEIILAAYAQWGADMMLRFNGMWAFAIWDALKRELFLARDRFGVKPLFYLRTAQVLAFASELKAFRTLEGFRPRVDTDTARHVFAEPFRVESSTQTLLKEVTRLQAGHCCTIDAQGRVGVRRWWNTLDHLPAVAPALDEQAEEFRELFFDSVRIRMRSDVSLGSCLSGGFDSTAVVCAMAQVEHAGWRAARQTEDWRHAFIAAFPGAVNDERPFAEEAAAFAKVRAHVFDVDESGAIEQVDRILHDFDDIYIGMPNAPWLIYRELRRAGVVVSLDGHGADELMGGYKQAPFLFLHDAPSLMMRPLQNLHRLRQINVYAGAAAPQPRGALARFFGSARHLVSWHPELVWVKRAARRARGMLRRTMRDGFVRLPSNAPETELQIPWDHDHLPDTWGSINRELYAMFHAGTLPAILRNFDRISMAHGVEVRSPFLDWRLVTYVMALPDAAKIGNAFTKRVARVAMRGRMPESIRSSRVKIGFNSPMPEWLNGPLRPWIDQLLADVGDDELISVERLRATYNRLQRGRGFSWSNCGPVWLALHWLWYRRSVESS